ncbi:MAG: LEA type 2 family protein [Sediminibacterium sp.]|jgi:LEA14-like dessication related protein
MKNWMLGVFLSFLFMACAAPKTFEYRAVKNIKLDQLGFDHTNLTMELEYYNPNSFGLDLKKMDADVYIDNRFLGKFHLDTLLHIPKKANFSLPSKIAVDMKAMYKNALNMVLSKEVLVSVKGTTRVGKAGIFRTVPFNYEGRHKVDLF